MAEQKEFICFIDKFGDTTIVRRDMITTVRQDSENVCKIVAEGGTRLATFSLVGNAKEIINRIFGVDNIEIIQTLCNFNVEKIS